MWSRVNLILCPVDNISSQTFIILIQRDDISCRFTLILGRLVNILSGSLLIWSRVTHILCPIINISCETAIIVIPLDNVSCRFDFIPSRLVDIWGGILKIWSRTNLIICLIDNILSQTVIMIQEDNILYPCYFIQGRLFTTLSRYNIVLSHCAYLPSHGLFV